MQFKRDYFTQLMMGGALLALATAPAMAAEPEAASQPAMASAAADPATSQNAEPVAQPAGARPTGSGLGDIVVTAMRRETNLQSTPIAISVLAPQALADRHVQSLYDLADGAAPSLRVATFEARQSALTVGIRGIVPF